MMNRKPTKRKPKSKEYREIMEFFAEIDMKEKAWRTGTTPGSP